MPLTVSSPKLHHHRSTWIVFTSWSRGSVRLSLLPVIQAWYSLRSPMLTKCNVMQSSCCSLAFAIPHTILDPFYRRLYISKSILWIIWWSSFTWRYGRVWVSFWGIEWHPCYKRLNLWLYKKMSISMRNNTQWIHSKLCSHQCLLLYQLSLKERVQSAFVPLVRALMMDQKSATFCMSRLHHVNICASSC